MRDEISAERLRKLLHYDPDAGSFTWLVTRNQSAKIGREAGATNAAGYRCVTIDGRAYMSHRLAWLYVYGAHADVEIDHINRDKADNRISNLRLVSRSENCQNSSSRRNTASGLRGVSWHKQRQRWAARITLHGLTKHLGLFDSPELAHAAYLQAAAELHTHNPLVTTQASKQSDQP